MTGWKRRIATRYALLQDCPGAILGDQRKRVKGRPSGPSEAVLQEAVDGEFQARGCFYHRIPDHVYQRAACEELRGFPDNLGLVPVKGTPFCLALPLELKRRNAKLRRGQTEVQKQIGTTRVDNLRDAIELIQRLQDAAAMLTMQVEQGRVRL